MTTPTPRSPRRGRAPRAAVPLAFVVACVATLAAGPLAEPAAAQAMVPLPDLGPAAYQGAPGGLYPDGTDQLPPAHRIDGKLAALRIAPLDASGLPDCHDGRVVVLSVGMSVASQVFEAWREEHSDPDPARGSGVILVNATGGGSLASDWADGDALWADAHARVAAVGATANQVQVAHLYLASTPAHGTADPFPRNAAAFADDLAVVARRLKAEFPNVQVAYLSSLHTMRHHSPQADRAAYEDGFGVKWVIERQIDGDPGLEHDPAAGPAVAPWLAWGPYFWDDAAVPGPTLGEAADFSDGAHLSAQGRAEAADLFDAFIGASTTAAYWYPADGACAPRPVSLAYRYGAGSPGADGKVPLLYTAMNTPGDGSGKTSQATPFLGNAAFEVHLGNVPANRLAWFLVSPFRAPLAAGVDGIHIDLPTCFPVAARWTQPNGVVLRLSVPNAPALEGLTMYGQWFVDDPEGATRIGDITLSASRGMEFRVAAP